MRTRLMPPLAAALLVCLLSGTSRAQWLKYPTPGTPRLADGKPDLSAPSPKTADGKPDLSGIWRASSGGYVYNVVSDLKPEEIQPWAETLYKERTANFSKDYPGYHCLPGIGPGIGLGMLGAFKILQTPNTIALLSEGFGGGSAVGPNAYHQIFLDGRELPIDPNPSWQGYSVGHWEGETLLVDSAGFNDHTWLDAGGHPHTEDLHVIQRFHRKDFGHMELKTTFNDPKVYARPWTISVDLNLVPDTEILEFVCNENERDLPHYVVTEEDRRKFRTSVKVAPEILAKYAGIYEVKPLVGRPLTYTVTLEGDRLMVQSPAGGGRFVLAAESETTFLAFFAFPAEIEFVKDVQGVVTHLVILTDEGQPKALRKGSAP